MKPSAKEVRNVLIELSKDAEHITTAQMAMELELITRKEKSFMYLILADMRSRGEVVRISKGVYQYKPIKKTYLKTIMWRILRSRQSVTVEDLMELAGSSESYAKDWLRMLQRQDVVQKTQNGRYNLVNDVVLEPVNRDKLEYFKDLRKRKKASLGALEKASNAINLAKAALQD